ncbi:MAG: twin-arginine translocase TatA/TatE family subunit [Melioribacter sp.]|nr:twin-arginine translocase TatA/TatE family subunit [Melioribacter sp.]
MFGNLGASEILIIVLVVLLLFGAKKIPELAQGIGKGMREFRKALREVEDDIKSIDKQDENKNNGDKS